MHTTDNTYEEMCWENNFHPLICKTSIFFFLLTKQEGGGGGGGGDIGVIRMGQSKENEYKQTKVAITTENGNMVPWQHELVPASRI